MSIEQTFGSETSGGPSLEEEAAALDARAAEAAKTVPANPDRPDWLPENFNTVADFVKSQNDGRAEITRLQQELAALKKPKEEPPKADDPPQQPQGEQPKTEETPAPKTPEELAQSSAEDQQKAAEEAVKTAGIDTTPFAEEFTQTGDVSPENREKLYEAFKGQFGEAAKTMVDGYIEGQKALAANFRNSAMTEAGGEDQYVEMTTWAKANMKPAEIDAYNRAVDSGDVNTALLAIRGLRQSFENTNGRAPNLVTGSNTAANSSATQPFASSKQMTDAINDPRYAKDDAYRAEIMRRIQMSNL